MPSSRPSAIPIVISLIKQLKPASILDVGIGYGKWGHLFREYTDILESEHNPARYHRDNWQVRIDGIEGYPEYITEMHRYLYSDILVGDLRELAPTIDRYDVIFLGDIIEHLDKQEGMEVLNVLLKKANKAVIVSTPKYETEQPDLCGNELERHRSLWSESDFQKLPNCRVTTVQKTLLLAVAIPPGNPMPRLEAEIAGLPATIPRRIVRKLRRIARSLIAAKPANGHKARTS